jgi:CBS domain-containing protein
MRMVRQLLGDKPRDIWTISPESSVFSALELLAQKNIGALPVVQGGKLVGIFSERDYARKVILKGRSSKEITIREIMTEQVITVRPETTIPECMKLMSDKHIRHLPAMEEDRIMGIISIGDVVKDIIAEQASTIHQLEDYIKGR